MKKILIGSPVRQKAPILEQFLSGIEEIIKGDFEYYYYFIDDNEEKESSVLLEKFREKYSANTIIIKGTDIVKDVSYYKCDENTHFWSLGAIKKVAIFKDSIIDYAKSNDFDYLFLIDSDIVIDKKSLLHLISRNVDIVSNVWWSQWQSYSNLEPQAFFIPSISYYTFSGQRVTPNNVGTEQAYIDFFSKLKVPGIYKVDGLCGCTLISGKALEKGVCFKKIPNLNMYGEDRDFCIRAGALGINLYIDTVYPAYHIYREAYLDRVVEFKEKGFSFDMCQTYDNTVCDKTQSYSAFSALLEKIKKCFRLGIKVLRFIRNRILEFYNDYHSNAEKKLYLKYKNVENKKIVLSMIVHNESNRYLKEVFDSVKDFVDFYFILDDASTDNTLEQCEQLLKDYPHKIVHNNKSLFSEEYKLRKLQWEHVSELHPGWILNIDADEVFDKNAGSIIKQLIKQDDIDLFQFRLYDMWNDKEYRNDDLWNAHTRFWPFLLRYNSFNKYKWKKTNQHCGRFPLIPAYFKIANIDIRVKHFGWSKEEDRINKYKRYMQLDGNGEFGNLLQYESILDKNPHLELFEDQMNDYSDER